MSEKTLTIIFVIDDKDVYGDIDQENPCVSIREEPTGAGNDCGGGAGNIVASLLSWVTGGDMSFGGSSGGTSDHSPRIYSSSLLVQDLSGSGYDLGISGAVLGQKSREERELTDIIHITPADVVDGLVDLTAGLLKSLPDTILSISHKGDALDDDFEKVPSFTSYKSGLGIAVSAAAYASFEVRYLATVDAYGLDDAGDGGYNSVVYSVGACGRIDDLDVAAGKCLRDMSGKWSVDYGYRANVEINPDDDDDDDGLRASGVDAKIVYDFCSKELISESPEGIASGET